MDKLPIKIDHNHIIDSVVEIRFAPAKNKDIFMDLLPVLRGILPNSSYIPNDIPKKLREADPQLKYQIEGTLKNETFSVGIGEHSILFNCQNGYKNWKEFFPFVTSVLEAINKLGLIDKILRVGVRFTNFFENKNDIKSLLNFSFNVGDMNVEKSNQVVLKFSSESEKIGYNVSIANQANLLFQNRSSGTLVDVDAFLDKDLPGTFEAELYACIEFVHVKEKEMFFSILRPDFLKSLNPVYE